MPPIMLRLLGFLTISTLKPLVYDLALLEPFSLKFLMAGAKDFWTISTQTIQSFLRMKVEKQTL